jgi:hypothetical protein
LGNDLLIIDILTSCREPVDARPDLPVLPVRLPADWINAMLILLLIVLHACVALPTAYCLLFEPTDARFDSRPPPVEPLLILICLSSLLLALTALPAECGPWSHAFLALLIDSLIDLTSDLLLMSLRLLILTFDLAGCGYRSHASSDLPAFLPLYLPPRLHWLPFRPRPLPLPLRLRASLVQAAVYTVVIGHAQRDGVLGIGMTWTLAVFALILEGGYA